MMGDMPKEVSRGVVKIGDVELVCVNLDDGRRVFTRESVEAFLGSFGTSVEELIGPTAGVQWEGPK